MTMTTAQSDVEIKPITLTLAEVRLAVGDSMVGIGRVGSQGDRWYWQHRDGEQSSPIAESRAAAAAALADYHRAFKPQLAQVPPSAPVRRLLFG